MPPKLKYPYKPETVKAICEEITRTGKHVKEVVDSNPEWPEVSTFFKWCRTHDEAEELYSEANNQRVARSVDGEKFKAVLDVLVSSADSLGNILKAFDITKTAWLWYLTDHPDAHAAYTIARENQAEVMADKVLEVAQEPSSDFLANQDKKIYIDALKWRASKLAPKVYGNNLNLNAQVNHNLNIKPQIIIHPSAQQLASSEADIDDKQSNLPIDLNYIDHEMIEPKEGADGDQEDIDDMD